MPGPHGGQFGSEQMDFGNGGGGGGKGDGLEAVIRALRPPPLRPSLGLAWVRSSHRARAIAIAAATR